MAANDGTRRTRIDSLPAEELTRILGQLGHEVGTPLGSILMMAEMLADASGGPGTRRHANGLQRAAKEIRDVVQAFVRLLRLRTGWLSPDPSDVDGAAVLQALRSAAEALGIHVTVAGEVPDRLRLDMAYLREAVGLCCSWADEPARPATLRIDSDQAGGLRCEIRCGGREIPWHEPAIFDPLGAGDLVPARRHDGPALRLPLAWMLVWRLGGRLTGRFDAATDETVLEMGLPAGSSDGLESAVE